MPGTVASDRDLAVLRTFVRRIDPSDAGAHNNLGVLYFRKGLFPEAVGCFAHALELDAKMAVAQRNLEIAYRRSGGTWESIPRTLLEGRASAAKTSGADGSAPPALPVS